MYQPPGRAGLYDPRFEHDSCGVSFVANIKGAAQPRAGAHRPASPSPTSSTAAPPAPRPTPATAPGSSSRSPTASCAGCSPSRAIELPPPGRYAVGTAFLPTDAVAVEKAQAAIEDIVVDRASPWSAGATCRSYPACLGATARAAMPTFQQLVVTDADPAGPRPASTSTARRTSPASASSTSSTPRSATYFPSLSSRTLVYKGMLTTPQLAAFFPDLARRALRERHAAGAQPLLDQHLPVVAARPPVPLRRPQRRDQHGAGQPELDARPRGDARQSACSPRLERAFPICTPGASDTARFDEVLELLHLGGRPLHHAVLMMIPEAWENNADDGPGGAGVLPLPRHA